MKLQASIEFLIVMSAIAGLSVLALASYSHIQAAQGEIFARISNASQIGETYNATGPGYSGLGITIVVSNTIYLGRDNQLEVVLANPGPYNVSGVYIGNLSWATASPQGYGPQAYSPIDVLQFSIAPDSAGLYEIVAYVEATGLGNTILETADAYAYAEPDSSLGSNSTPGNSTATQFSAYITDRNESLSYALGQQEEVLNFSYSSHCAYHDFWGNREPEPQQCGPDSWGFVTGDSSCNQFWFNGNDRYYCFYASATGNSVSTIAAQPSPEYGMELVVYNDSLSLHSMLSSANQQGPLLNGANVTSGYASVSGAYQQGGGPQPYLNYVVLDSGSPEIINSSAYSAYSSQEQSLVSELSIYNNSSADGDTLNYVLKVLASADSAKETLLDAQRYNSSGCSPAVADSNSVLTCASYSPLSYDILANLTAPAANQSITYQGSLITIR